MGLQSGLLHLILKCDAQQQEQRTQNTHAAQRGLGELAVPLFIIRGGLPNVYGTACAAALRGTDRDYGFSVSHGSDGAVGVHNSYRRVRACPLQCHSGRFLYSHSGDQVLLAADAVQQKNVCIQRDFANFGSDRYGAGQRFSLRGVCTDDCLAGGQCRDKAAGIHRSDDRGGTAPPVNGTPGTGDRL